MQWGNYGGGWYNKGKPGEKEENPKENGKEKEKERKERRKEEKEKEKKEKEKEKGQKADASIVEAHITLEIAPKRATEKVSSTLLTGWSEKKRGKNGRNRDKMREKQFANYLVLQLLPAKDPNILQKSPTSLNLFLVRLYHRGTLVRHGLCLHAERQ